jgi:hypothetical protein
MEQVLVRRRNIVHPSLCHFHVIFDCYGINLGLGSPCVPCHCAQDPADKKKALKDIAAGPLPPRLKKLTELVVGGGCTDLDASPSVCTAFKPAGVHAGMRAMHLSQLAACCCSAPCCISTMCHDQPALMAAHMPCRSPQATPSCLVTSPTTLTL